MNEWVTLEDINKAYIICRKRKRTTESCAIFEINEAQNLYTLWEELNNGTYKIGLSNAFCVTRPKLREVFAADFRDRIVHHLLMLRTMDLFEKHFIENSYNCRVGKGTQFGHLQMQKMAAKYKDGWVLSCDIQGFFMSIPKQKLAEKLQDFLAQNYTKPDKEQIIALTKQVALHAPEKLCILKGDLKLFSQLPKDKSLRTCGDGLGMAIGNLTSQIYANFYLSSFDYWIENKVGKMAYGRYVDDFKVFANTKEELLELLPQIREFLKNDLQLTLHPKKWELQPVRKGFKWLGVNLKQGRIYSGNRTIGNLYSVILKYNPLPSEEMKQSVHRYVQRMNSYLGYLKHHYSYSIRYKLWGQISNTVKCFVSINRKLTKLSVKPKYKDTNKLKNKYYGIRKQHPRSGLHKEETC